MTMIEIGSSVLRLCPTVATGSRTRRTSSPAYAVEEIASDANTARAMIFVSRWWPSSAVGIGRPTRNRLSVEAIGLRSAPDQEVAHGVFAVGRDQHEHLVALEQRRVAA